MARLNLYTKDYVVFDLETTGLSPLQDEIIEISGIRVREGKTAGEYSTLVNPGRKIPSSASLINGITDNMVREAPALKTALEGFLDFAGQDILVGHNIHSFDMKFLQAGMLRELGRELTNDYVDTLYLAKGLLSLPRYRLTDLAQHFHIETAGAHRALQDCVMNQQCYEKLAELPGMPSGDADHAPVCPRCGSLLMKRNGKYGSFWGCSGFPGCRYTRNA